MSAAKNAVVSLASLLRGISILCQFASFLWAGPGPEGWLANYGLIVQVYWGVARHMHRSLFWGLVAS